ncbi:hypothetical protein [Specibacter cremeus]|uniref:hypothetical protein n=1 Tax=Specibacter cremeus TaxID=1629051 RepID=UPI000F7B7E32|nr:hypothetical protein [Specibacter cremeus]
MRDSVTPRRHVELVLVPIVAAIAMAFVVGAIMLHRDGTCPAAGWSNAVKVATHGNLDDVAAVTSCAGLGCVPQGPSFANRAKNGVGLLVDDGRGKFVLNVGMADPTSVTLRAFDSSGRVLAQQRYELNWTRVGGTQECGGPMVTDQLALAIP